MNTENRYYIKSRKEQIQIQLYIGSVALFTNVIFILLALFSKIYLIPFLTIPLTISIIAPFYDTPSMVNQGKLKYYSSFVLAEERKGNKINIHGGTLFDYFFTLNRSTIGNQQTKIVLKDFVKGLLKLLEEYENNHDGQIIIRGTTYILNEKTIKKFGFKKVQTSFIQSLILFFNYANLLISNSFVKRKLSFPRLKNIITFEAELSQLLKKKVYLKSLYDRLFESN